MKQTYKKYCCLGIPLDYSFFCLLRFLFSGVLFFLLLFTKYRYIVAPLASILFYYGIEFFLLDIPLYKKAQTLEKDASLFFTIFLLHMEENGNMKQSLEITCSLIDNSITKEFQYVLKDSFVGDGFFLRMEELVRRCASSSVKNILFCLLEDARTGNQSHSTIKLELQILKQKIEEERLRKYKRVFYKLGIYTILACIGVISIFFVFLILVI